MASPVASLHTWKNQLVRRRDGTPYPDERNVKIALEEAPELKGILQYDEFCDRIELKRALPGTPRDELDKFFGDDAKVSWADEHVTELTIWLTVQGFTSLRKSTVQDTVIAVAKRHGYHPVRAFLEECEAAWDGTARLGTWLKVYLGAKDHAAYLEAVGPKFLTGAVARIFEPGCQMDSILVLEGEQGRGKSKAVEILGMREWARDITGDLSSKDAAVGIQSVWIGEMAELSSLKRSDQEAVKGFISRRIDHYRPPYGRNAVDRPRHTVFIATTNEDEYLQDPTGARRFWPVACAHIDLAALKAVVCQLWGEAVRLYRERVPWHLDDAQVRKATIEQAARQRCSTVDVEVLQYADALLEAGIRRIQMRQLLEEVFDLNCRKDPGKSSGVAVQAARALVREGWVRLKPVGRGKTRVQGYEFPETLPCEPYEPPAQASQGSQGSQGDLPQLPTRTDEDIPF